MLNEFFNTGSAAASFEISNSLRFSGAQYLDGYTQPAGGDESKWTISFWIKEATISENRYIISFGTNPTDTILNGIWLRSDDTLEFFWRDGSSTTTRGLRTNAVYRDPSAWYHVVLAFDRTVATKLRLYVNGAEVDSFSVDDRSTLTGSSQLGPGTSGVKSAIGDYSPVSSAVDRLEGYLTELHYVDGQALAPTDFGEFNADGVWVPKEVSGVTYGVNGFYLTFDPSATNGIGHDHSGNGNNFSPTGFDTTNTAASTYDVMSDTPTTNWCTMNPLDADQLTLSNGNLGIAATAGDGIPRAGTIAASSGKWYWEFEVVTASTSFGPAWGFSSTDKSVYALQRAANTNVRSAGCTINSTNSGNITSGTVGVALDIDAGTATIYHNNSSVATVSGIPAGTYTLAYTADGATDVSNLNAGQHPFTYSAPSGFKALCTANLPAPTIKDGSTAMDVVLYDGNGATQTITGLNFSPDLVWLKCRDQGDDHSLQDTVRGAGDNRLRSNNTGGENTQSGQISSFNSDGWTMGNRTNENGKTYVGWVWDAGSSTGTNADGSITSSVRVNVSAGFSIVSYTGNGTQGATIGHGLGAAPSMIITKGRDSSGSWPVYHSTQGAGQYGYLDTTGAFSSSSGFYGGVEPTSTVYTVGFNARVNGNNNTYIAYCFAPVEGYSAFGSYEGNQDGTNGPFIYTGFKPRWVILKCADTGGTAYDWNIFDTLRDPYNLSDSNLKANLPDQEGSTNGIDILSNGFKIRSSNNAVNVNTMIYAAFAENPFGGQGVAPVTAR